MASTSKLLVLSVTLLIARASALRHPTGASNEPNHYDRYLPERADSPVYR